MRKVKNRKVHNKEIERQKKQRARLIATIAACALAAVIAAVAWVVWDMHSRGWILRFEGARIPTNELRLFMSDTTPEAKQGALDVLIERLVLLHLAEQHGIGFTEEEREMWAWMVEMEMGGVPYVTSQRAGELLAVQFGEIWERLMDVFVPEIMVLIDEDVLAADFLTYFEENEFNYLDMDVRYVFLDSEEDAEAARARILNGEASIDDILRENDETITDETELTTMGIGDFINAAGLEGDTVDMLVALQEGDVSEIIEWGAEWGDPTYILVYVLRREEADRDEAWRAFRERYILTTRNQMMLDLLPQWVEDADITINQRALDLA